MLITSQPSRPGFEAIVKNEGFKCAFITHDPMYAYGAVTEMKRHNLTDELFVLMAGKAILLIREGETMSEHPLEQGKSYNVTAGTWHYLGASEDAMLFVTEAGNTDKTNTDVLTLTQEYRLQEK